jgi:hypothetical protein
MRLFTCIALLSSFLAAQSHQTKNVILFTADGLRWQDLFTGIDPMLMNEKEASMKDAKDRRERYWRTTPEERRKQLMPFFWKELAARGAVFGNVSKGSSMKVTNAFRVSYPGYAEMLTGHSQDAVIDGNVNFQNPSETVLEFARHRLSLDCSQVALFASWNAFLHIGESKPGTITINAGYQAFDGGESGGGPRLDGAGARMRDLSRGQFLALSPWDEERHDYFTFEMAMEYLRAVKPRVLFISFDETDDWAHDKRYDRVLDSIHYFDQCLRELFAALDAMPEYKGSTSVIVTTDHGRGSTLPDWSDHGKKVAGAEQVWMAIAGPDTPAAGEMRNVPEIHQRDIAPTILDLLGLDPAGMKGMAGGVVRVKAF